jgi:hypothetical protein
MLMTTATPGWTGQSHEGEPRACLYSNLYSNAGEYQ